MRSTRSGRACTTDRAPASPVSSESAPGEGGEQRRHDGVRRLWLVAERDQHGARPQRKRLDADGDRARLSGLRPRVHGEAHREPSQRVPDRGVVVARDDDEILDVRQETFDRPAYDGLALETQQELLPPHPPGQARRKDDARNHAG
jgi:hypothetical protein